MPRPRPFTPRQSAENARFLEALRRTGNTRLAARELGVHRGTYFKRRAKHPDFAAEWDEALNAADVALKALGLLGRESVRPDLQCRDRQHPLGADEAAFAHSSFLARDHRDPAHEMRVQMAGLRLALDF